MKAYAINQEHLDITQIISEDNIRKFHNNILHVEDGSKFNLKKLPHVLKIPESGLYNLVLRVGPCVFPIDYTVKISRNFDTPIKEVLYSLSTSDLKYTEMLNTCIYTLTSTENIKFEVSFMYRILESMEYARIYTGFNDSFTVLKENCSIELKDKDDKFMWSFTAYRYTHNSMIFPLWSPILNYP